MNNKLGIRPLTLAVCLALAPAAAISTPAFAESSTHAVIDSASADSALANLTLVGRHFSTVKKLNVFMAGVATPLPIVSVTDTVLVAQLPAGITPGSYIVSVGDGNGNDDEDFFVTLGAAGATGPTGQAAGTVYQSYGPGTVIPNVPPPGIFLGAQDTITVPSNASVVVTFSATAQVTSGPAGCPVEHTLVLNGVPQGERVIEGLLAPQFGVTVPNTVTYSIAYGSLPPGPLTIQLWHSTPCPNVELNNTTITTQILMH